MDMRSMKLVHDLKVPIQLIFSCAQLLQLELKQDSHAAEYLQMMLSSAQQLRHMVTDVLDQDQPAASPEGMKNIDVVSEVRGICRRCEIYAESSGKRVNFASNAASLRMRTDSDMLVRVLQNLMSNALRYTPCGKSVDVQLNALGDFVEIAVIDHGCGIPRDQLSRIFEVGVSDGSTGYGLSIVREGARALGGSVSVESDSNGSRFTVRLPVR